jgi:transglutaminase/protease-like cytokinesis protein 3
VVKLFLSISLTFFSLAAFSQNKSYDFSTIDHKVKFIHAAEPVMLAKQLAALGNTDREKTRAIFRWITEHIDYNVKLFNRSKKTGGIISKEPEDTAGALPSLNDRVAAKVLRRKIAFCDGYSRLFKTLCDHAGIRSEIIAGYAHTNFTGRRLHFGVNHTWNAVYFDSAWHLLDVTWASGHVSYFNEYVRQYDDQYFLTPPEQFIRDHYPEDAGWTLLPDHISFREFTNSPFRYSAYVKTGILSHLPARGIIEAASGDTVNIELKTKTIAKSFFVAEAPLADSVYFFLQPSFTLSGEKINYSHTISPTAGNWLYVYYNDEIVMRYRLKIKKETSYNKRGRPDN